MVTGCVLDIIGNTLPILLDEEHIFVKAEFLELGGSIKNRVTPLMIEGAENEANVRAERQLAKWITGSITSVLPERAECYSRTALM